MEQINNKQHLIFSGEIMNKTSNRLRRSGLRLLLVSSLMFPLSLFAEAVGDKEGYLKQVSNDQLESQIHENLIKQIEIINPKIRFGPGAGSHYHPAIPECTNIIKHAHPYINPKHTHRYSCKGSSQVQTAPVAEPAAAPQASSTNVQEYGVDEADLVKTDGRYLFAINNDDYQRRASGIRIFDTKVNTEQPKQIATIGFQKHIRLTGMYLIPEKNQLVVLGNSHRNYLKRPLSQWSRGRGGSTHIIKIDIRNKMEPNIIRQVEVEGYSRTTRRINNMLYMVLSGSHLSLPPTSKYIETKKPMTKAQLSTTRQNMVDKIKQWKIKDALPHYQVRGEGSIKALVNQGEVMVSPGEINGLELITLLAIDLDAKDFQFETLNYFGNYTGSIYASKKAFYISSGHHGTIAALDKKHFPNDLSQHLIHKMAFHKKGFDYRGTGAVLGDFSWGSLSSFQVDEDNKGNLRVVTSNWRTSGQSKEDPATQSPVILTALAEHPHNKQLITLSRLPNKQQPKALGKRGEQLYGVRLFNDYAYFVTFKKSDPLYVVDLRNPRNMRVTGELVIPGFSDYLHPISQYLLLGVGKAADEQQGNEWAAVQGLKLSLFDISNPQNPREVDKIEIGKRGTYSPANNNHYAFTHLKTRNSNITRVALPI